MILVISAREDIHARVVRAELDRLGVRSAQVDLYELGKGAGISFGQGEQASRTYFDHEGNSLDLNETECVWYRRPRPSVPPPTVRGEDTRRFVEKQWRELVDGSLRSLGCRFINHPFAQSNCSKPLQLAIAQRVKLSIPDTLITSCPDAARDFVSRHAVVVHKILASPAKRFLYTKKWDPEEDEHHLKELELAPIIFQAAVPGDRELRITIVGSRVFAAEFQPQGHIDGRTDIDAEYRPHKLPVDVEHGIRELMRELGLVYATVDMKIKPNGEYVFLELNPQGQFLYVEIKTGLPIAASLAELLSGKSCSAELGNDSHINVP